MRHIPLALAVSLLASPGAAEEGVLADLPFLDSEEPNRIYLDLAPPGNDRPFRILLDTGATFSVFTPRAARENGISVRPLKNDPHRRKTVTGEDLQFYVDTRSSDTAARQGEYGLLGGNFLEKYVIELDFAARRVRFLDRKRHAIPESASAEGEAVLPLKVVSSRPVLEIAVNGQPTWALLDTGAPDGVSVGGDMAARAGIEIAPGSELAIRSVAGPVKSHLAEARSVRIGPFELAPAPVVVSPRGFMNFGFPGDGLVGYDVLAEFSVRLDYEARRIWLRRRPDARRTLFGGDYGTFTTEGVLLVEGPTHFTVAALREDSPAARRGVRIDDRIPKGQGEAAIAADLRQGREVVVARELDGIWVDTVLEAAAP